MFIVKVPGINGEKSAGCEKAGNAIFESLKEISFNEQGKSIDVKLLDLEEIHLDNGNLELSNKLIYENSLEIFETKPKTIFLGGDHSISYSINRAFLDFCKSEGKEPCLIVFDAHSNCMPFTPKGKNKFPTNREWVRALVDFGFPPKNILLAATRNIRKEEMDFLRSNGIKIVMINQIFENIEDSCDMIMEFSERKELYVSIDISVIDPAFAPSTKGSEPGGLTSRQFLYLIQRMNKIKNLKALDLVEINEKEDKDKMTVKLGAKILGELI